MLTTELADTPTLVFHGGQASCRELGLVLEAKGIAFEIAERADIWLLLVPATLLPRAQDELARYTLERSVPREHPPAFVPLPGVAFGSIGFTIVLLLSGYCAGIALFGTNWFAAGALERNALGGFDWWRSVTALTLHVDQLHLLSNLLFGVAVGAIVSAMFGPGIAWLSILIAGALGNALELIIAPLDHRAVGASTAVFAALGLLSGFGWRSRLSLRERWLHQWAPLIAGVCLLTLLGAGAEGEHVDVLGHLLGFSTGVALGWTYSRLRLPRTRNPRVQLAAGLAAIMICSVSWMAALRLLG